MTSHIVVTRGLPFDDLVDRLSIVGIKRKRILKRSDYPLVAHIHIVIDVSDTVDADKLIDQLRVAAKIMGETP